MTKSKAEDGISFWHAIFLMIGGSIGVAIFEILLEFTINYIGGESEEEEEEMEIKDDEEEATESEDEFPWATKENLLSWKPILWLFLQD